MPSAPIFDETLLLKASAFEGISVRAGIDRGCSLTKIAFVPKDAPSSDNDTVPLRCLTFRNADFEDALRVMKAEARLPDKGELHVTGIGYVKDNDAVTAILGLDVVFINEMATIGRGAYLLINNAKPEHIFHPIPKLKDYPFDSDIYEKFQTYLAQCQSEGDSDPSFPAEVLYVGSGAMMINVLSDGTGKFAGGLALSGRPFMGLANLLLGTNKYDEVMSLADKGDQGKVDFQVKDIMRNDPNSPYARFPAYMPMFAFGKASEDDWSSDKCSREDLAQSLVAFFATEICTLLTSTISVKKTKKIYLTGNFFRAEIVRRLIYEKLFVSCQGMNIQLLVLNSGHTGAIAAMLTNAEDVDGLLEFE